MMSKQIPSIFCLFLVLAIFIASISGIPSQASSSPGVSDLNNSCVVLEADGDFFREMLRNPKTGQIENRIALVIGNGAYNGNIFEQLANPTNDAMAISLRMQALGFQVVRGIDLNIDGLSKCLIQFYGKLKNADTALFYYAGHGVQADDHNYILPNDATIRDGNAVGFFEVDRIIDRMRDREGTSLVLLDACRDNGASGKITTISGKNVRSLGRGLASLNLLKDTFDLNLDKKEKEEVKGGIFLAFATSPNQTALDGGDKHSPFTQAFLKNVGISGYSVGRVMSGVTNDVGEATEWTQTPWMRSSLNKPFYFNGNREIAELLAISNNLSKESTALLNKGKKLNSIVTALKGIPSNLTPPMVNLFQKAHDALYTAFKSVSISLPLEGEFVTAKISEDGNILATAPVPPNPSPLDITIWNAKTGREIAKVDHSRIQGAIQKWALSSDGKKIASLSKDGLIEIWDTASGNSVLNWKAHLSDPMSSVSFNWDGSKLVTKGGKQLVRVWDIAIGTKISELSYSSQSSTSNYGEKLKGFLPDNYPQNQLNALVDQLQKRNLLGMPQFTPDGEGITATVSNVANLDPKTGETPTNIAIWGYPH